MADPRGPAFDVPPVVSDPRGPAFNRPPTPAPEGFKRDAIAWKSLYDKNGKAVALSKLTDAQIREYLALPKNKGALANGWTMSGGKVVHGNAAAQPSAPSTPVGVTTPGSPTSDGSDAYLTDPWYQQQRAELDSELQKSKIERDRLLGDGSAKGQIESDWQYAIDALTRNTRRSTSQTNADISGSNLAGSGIARKALSDIAADMLAESGKLNTDRTRNENAANLNWQDAQDTFNRSDLAGMRQATERWKALNSGVPLENTTTNTASASTGGGTAGGKVTAPAGMQYTLKDPKNPKGGWTLQPKKTVNRVTAWATKNLANTNTNKNPNDKFLNPTTDVKKPAAAAPAKSAVVTQVKPAAPAKPAKAVAPPGTKFVKQPNGTYKAVKI